MVDPDDDSKPNLRRPGWAWPELLESLLSQPDFSVGAFDFPFSIPFELLVSADFASRVGRSTPFRRRIAWQKFVASKLSLAYGPNGAMDLRPLEAWRDKKFWVRRATDQATNGQPPLKDMFQNLFPMTVAGAAFLHALSAGGVRQICFQSPRSLHQSPSVFETYPRQIARAIAFSGSYKKDPKGCINCAIAYLAGKGIDVKIAPTLRSFCEQYRSGNGKNKTDPDGADAFLCLVAAICFREGIAENCRGSATAIQLRREGCIICTPS